MNNDRLTLQQLRVSKGLTQKQLTELSGVSFNTIVKYENGQRDINKACGLVLYRLARALDCKMEDLINIDIVK